MRIAIVVCLGLLFLVPAGCAGRAERPDASTGRSAVSDLVRQWQAEEGELAIELACSLTTGQVEKANSDEGLPYSELDGRQQQVLTRLWEISHDMLVTAGRVPERARQILEPGPIEEARVLKVGYAFVPEETREHTLVRIDSGRYPVRTFFDGTIKKPHDLTPALEAHGINFSETGEVRRWKHPPPELVKEMEEAEEEAMQGGGEATASETRD